jgi:bifunctional non-homologous end joining protein LigD
MPASIRPMLATLSASLPADQERWSFEYKWDGVRAIAYWDGRRLKIESRNQLEITHRYPELHALAEAMGSRTLVLDGEIVALDAAERPSFERLQRRMHVQDRGAIRRLMGEVPVYYLIFDLLYLDGRSLTSMPLIQRRDMLEELTLVGATWRLSPADVAEGQAMLEAARQQNLEGIVAKRLDSLYEPGRRSPAWLKIKIIARQEFVVGGWVPEGNQDRGRVGALMLGYYEPQARGARRLRYAGSVGSGFNAEWHRRLVALLAATPRTDSPFADAVPKAGVRFVEPKLVTEVEYRRWPAGGMVQQAAFKGLRVDKDPQHVVDERVCVGESDR